MTRENLGDDAARGEELSARFAADDAKITAMEAEIAALKARATHANHRADASEARAQADHERIEALESRADLEALLIADLQAEGIVSSEHAAHLEVALRSARTIGAAIDIVMAKHGVSDVDAFDELRQASMDTNRKLRDLADEVVHTGEVTLQDE